MPDWDALLGELRTIRGRLDQLAAAVFAEKSRAELMPIWDCGHQHPHRAAAIACREEARRVLAEAETEDGA